MTTFALPNVSYFLYELMIAMIFVCRYASPVQYVIAFFTHCFLQGDFLAKHELLKFISYPFMIKNISFVIGDDEAYHTDSFGDDDYSQAGSRDSSSLGYRGS